MDKQTEASQPGTEQRESVANGAGTRNYPESGVRGGSFVGRGGGAVVQ